MKGVYEDQKKKNQNSLGTGNRIKPPVYWSSLDKADARKKTNAGKPRVSYGATTPYPIASV